MSMLGWLAVAVCSKAIGGDEDVKKEEGQQEKEGGWGGGVDHETVTALQRESSSWPKRPSG